MRKVLASLILILILLSCGKKEEAPTPEPQKQDETPKTDFRESYTGDFVVDIITYGSYNTAQLHLDTFRDVKIHFSYAIDDTVYCYYPGFTTSQLPAMKMTIIDTTLIDKSKQMDNHLWGMEDSTQYKLNYSQCGPFTSAANYVINSGGFINTDSINFSYHFTDPHISRAYSMQGKRVK
ncbi:MAG: hypothetical protein H6550_03885 [Chitinophagales bacterium]|nr:hypothetical protein [Chitinophagales bacterium]